MNIYRRLLLVAILFFCGSLAMHAQSITIDGPAPGSVDVAIRPVITLRTDLRFDPSSIAVKADSIPYGDTARPTILLLPKAIADSIPDSLRNRLSIRGAYTLNHDVLEFQPDPNLDFNTEYEVRVLGLRAIDDAVIGPGIDTVPLPDTTFTFTTVYDAHHIVGFSHEGSARCGDTFRLQLNRPLSSTTVSGSPLLRIERIDSIVYDDDTTFHYATSPISATTWIGGPNNTVLYLKPNAPLAASYFGVWVDSDLGLLTGDPQDNASFPIQVRDIYRFEITPVAENPLHGTPSSSLVSHAGVHYAKAGDQVLIGAVVQDATFGFLRWECPGNSMIHNSTEPVLDITQSCASLRDLDIKAIYRKRDTIRVDVDDTTGIGVTVYRKNPVSGLLVGTSGPATYYLAPGESMLVRANTSSTAEFDSWESNAPLIDGNTSNMLRISNDWPIGVGGGIGPIGIKPVEKPVRLEYGLCTEVDWFEYPDETMMDAKEAVTITPDPCISSNTPDMTTVSVTVNWACYEIAYIAWNNGEQEWAPGNGPTSWQRSFQLTKPYTMVSVYIRPTKRTLTLETSLTDRWTGIIGKEKDVRIGVYMVSRRTGKMQLKGYSADGTTPSLIPPDFDYSNNNFDFNCGELVRLIPEFPSKENGFTFLHWTMGPGYEFPLPNTTPSLSITMDQNRRAHGVFNEGFRLRQIGLYRNDNTSSVEWFTPKEMRTWKDPADNVQKAVNDANIFHTPATGYGTKVRFRFNAPASRSSVSDRLSFYDLSDRIDEKSRQLYRISSGFSWFESDKVVEATVKNGTYGIPKGESFSISALAGIVRASDNAPLKNPESALPAETEMPGVDVVVKKIWAMDTQGDGGVEMFTVTKAVIVKPDGTVETSTSDNYQLPRWGCYNYVNPTGSITYNETVLTHAKMKKEWGVGLNLSTLDNDDDDDCQDSDGLNWNASGALLGAAIGGGIGTLVAKILALTGLAAVSAMYGGALIGLLIGGFWKDIVDFIANVFGGKPDLMGTASWRYNWRDFFGAKSHLKWQQTQQDAQNDPQVKWEVDFKLRTHD